MSSPPLLKRHFFIVAAAVVLGLMVVAAVLRIAFAQDEGPGGPGGPGGRAQTVSEAVVANRQFSDQIDVLGIARGRRSVDITSNATELISRVMFEDGQRVAAGTPLVELQAGEEEADIIMARASLDQAERDRDRWRTLAERGVAPRVTAEQAQTAFETAQATLRAAQSRRGDRVIRAPFSGIVGLSDVTAGTLINPGTVIATLDDTSVIRVDFPVSERYLSVLRPGLSVQAAAEAFPDQPITGRIALIDTRINEDTGAVLARAEFPNPGGRIRPGMTMRVSVEQGVRQAPAVPESAVQFEGATAFVYRIAPQPGGGAVAQRVTVETGAVENGFVEILSGLSATDRVVGSGLNRIQPGAPITVPEKTRAAAPAGPAAKSAGA